MLSVSKPLLLACSGAFEYLRALVYHVVNKQTVVRCYKYVSKVRL